MRYDTPIFFQRVQSGAYDAASGNYGEDTVTEEKRYASVTNTNEESLKVLYGTIKQHSLTIRLQRPYETPFDTIRVGDEIYKVDLSRRNKSFIVSGVQ